MKEQKNNPLMFNEYKEYLLRVDDDKYAPFHVDSDG